MKTKKQKKQKKQNRVLISVAALGLMMSLQGCVGTFTTQIFTPLTDVKAAPSTLETSHQTDKLAVVEPSAS